MTSVALQSGQIENAFWWHGSLMTIRARGVETGGVMGLVEGAFYEGFGPPLHVHHREDEAMYVLEGMIRFRQGDDEFVGGPGSLVWGPRGVPHAFKVLAGGARALVYVTPAGFERIFQEGGVPVSQSTEPPSLAYDPEAARMLAQQFGFDVVGPPLA